MTNQPQGGPRKGRKIGRGPEAQIVTGTETATPADNSKRASSNAMRLESGLHLNGGPILFAELSVDDFIVRVGGTYEEDPKKGTTTIHSGDRHVDIVLNTDAQGALHGRYVAREGRGDSWLLDNRTAILTGGGVILEPPPHDGDSIIFDPHNLYNPEFLLMR